MVREKSTEKLIGLLNEARRTKLDAVTSGEKLKEAYGYATHLALKVKITNPGGVISWINCLMDKIVSDRDTTSNDLSCYCKIILDILDHDFDERYTQPAPKPCQ